MKKVLSILGDILIAVIMIVAVVMTVLVVSSSKSNAKVPTLFGYSLMSVQSDSMDVEGGFAKGDLIVVRTLTDEQCNTDLQVGDVVTYIRYYQNQGFLETHRIVANTPDVNPDYAEIADEVKDGVWEHEGTRFYMTMGDNPNSVFGVDLRENNKVEYAGGGNIVGKWEGAKLAGFGKVMDFMKSSTGFMVCVVLPVAMFFIYELYIFIMTLSRKQKEKTLAEVADKEAELKAKAVAEFLAQQQANGGNTTPADTKPAEPAQDAEPAKEPAEPAAEPEKEAADAKEPEKSAESAPAADLSQVSEEEKNRIIQEYLAKQAQENKE